MTFIEEYISKQQDTAQKAELSRVYRILNPLMVNAEEGIAYGIPSFKYNGHFVIGLAAHKKFVSLYPASKAIEILATELRDYQTSKGAIRFTPENSLSEELIKQIVNIRLKDFSTK